MWLELLKSFFFGFLLTLALRVDAFYILESKYGKLGSESHFSVVSPNSYKNISACSENYPNLDVSLGLDGVNLYIPFPPPNLVF